MHFPRLPDWIIYLVVVLALLFAALGRREHANAPPAPPPMPGEAGLALAPASAMDPTVIIDAPDRTGPDSGTGFSVGDGGVWITARHVVEGCRRTAVVVGEGRGVAARVHVDLRGEAAILTTEGGAPPCPWPRRRACAGAPKPSIPAIHRAMPARSPRV